MQGKSLFDYPIHVGEGARTIPQPEFTGISAGTRLMISGMAMRVRRVASSRSTGSSNRGAAGKCIPPATRSCAASRDVALHQEHADGSTESVELGPGEYAINPPGTWHTADTLGPVVGLFITAGKDTTHRPR